MKGVAIFLAATAFLQSVAIDSDRVPGQVACHRVGALPDPDCTPGKSERLPFGRLCDGTAHERRNVSEATKRMVFSRYGIDLPVRPGDYEVDHLVPLELGGTNDAVNLWPQPAEPVPGYRQKDALENRLHREVCAGTLDADEARQQIRTDWVAAYRREFGR
jgi:hypothetical protein